MTKTPITHNAGREIPPPFPPQPDTVEPPHSPTVSQTTGDCPHPPPKPMPLLSYVSISKAPEILSCHPIMVHMGPIPLILSFHSTPPIILIFSLNIKDPTHIPGATRHQINPSRFWFHIDTPWWQQPHAPLVPRF